MGQGQELLISSGFAGINLRKGDHLCHVYYGNEHLLTKVVPFITAGLDNDEKCLIFLSDEMVKCCSSFLGSRGETAAAEGRLAYADAGLLAELCQQGSEDLERFLLHNTREALTAGFKMLRLAVDMVEVLARVGADKMREAGLNLGSIVSGLHAVMLVEYPFNPDQDFSVLLELSRLHTVFLNEPLPGDQEE